jgi:hypothetical protein
MRELQLARTPGDRRLYALEDVGTLRLEGWFSRRATIEAVGRSWSVARSGVLTTVIEARDVSGTTAGTFRGRGLRRGGTLTWAGRDLTLRPASTWRERYALADGDRELAVLEGRGWGRRPVRVLLADDADVDAGLLLFAAFVVRALAEDQSATAAGASTAATSAATSG